jgi:threonine dehydratase
MIFMPGIPTKEDIIDAHKRIREHIHRTPILTSSSINEIAGADIYFKCENFQKIGAFKFRGATNVVNSIPDDQISKGVATHSSGNHAAALSLAAKKRGAAAHIVMPHTAPETKKKAVMGYGGEIIYCEPTLEARETTLEKVVEKTGAIFVHGYDNYKIIEGQATCAKEIIEDINNLDFITVPCGGGGLTSGTALSAHYFSDGIKVIAAEPSGADDAYRSFRDGKIYPSINPKTIADGLLTSLSEKTFEIISRHVSEILTVDDEYLINAMRIIWERMKIVVEPSGAISLAVILANREKFRGKKIAVILSGGNVDLEKLPWI